MASSYVQSSSYDNQQVSSASTLNADMLKPLDEVLRCHICFDYFTNCMVTRCSHNYCSLCIRRYMTYKSQCPTCFQEATEPELQNNRLIDEILQVYKKIRARLQIPCETINISLPEQSTSSKSLASNSSEKVQKPNTSTSSVCDQQNIVSPSDEVPCPVCCTPVPSSRINIHLDNCLKQTEVRKEQSERKFLPKLVYHLLSEKDLKKKLKEHGLSTAGGKQAMVRRHRNFVILYNANCDSLNPKPVSDLLLEIERQELEERCNPPQRVTRVTKASDPSEIEKEYDSYAQEHKSQFNALIQDVQQRVLDRQIKKEVDVAEATTNITDAAGNLIGEATLRVPKDINLEPVVVKEEPPDSPPLFEDPVIVKEEPAEPLQQEAVIKEELSESLLEDLYLTHNKEDETMRNEPSHQPDTDLNKTSQLPFRIRKSQPTVKIKEEPQFLLNSSANQDSKADSPSSLDDFQTNKVAINKFHKKKNARRLSTEEKNSQRKK